MGVALKKEVKEIESKYENKKILMHPRQVPSFLKTIKPIFFILVTPHPHPNHYYHNSNKYIHYY